MRTLLLLSLVLAVSACGPPSPPATSAPKTVVLVTIDTLRADHTSAFGYLHDTTPNLKALAARGMAFDLCHAQHVETGPSIASVMTSRHPREIGVRQNGDVLPGEFSTLAERFRAAGFTTAAFVSTYLLKPHACGLERGFAYYDEQMTERNLGHDDFERRARETVDRSVAWLKATAGRDRFLWVHLYDPHGKYDPERPENRRRFPASNIAMPLRQEQIVSYQRFGDSLDAGDYIARYDGEIFEADEALGRLIVAAGPDAVMAVGADHGESLGEDDYWFRHGSLLNRASLHVPLVIAGPGVPAGRRHSSLVRNLDVAPTLLDLAGLDPLSNARGRSLVRDHAAPFGPCFAEARRGGGSPGRDGIDMGYKLSLTLPTEHFVWRVGREPCPHPALEQWIRKLPDRRAGDAPPADVDDALRGLGYIR